MSFRKSNSIHVRVGKRGNHQRNNRWFDTSGLLCSDGWED